MVCFGDFLVFQKHIFGPLGMTRSSWAAGRTPTTSVACFFKRLQVRRNMVSSFYESPLKMKYNESYID